MATIRVLRTVKATMTRVFYLDEVATDATGTVSVAITRLDGTAVESGSASGPSVAHEYTYTFGGRDVLDLLIATWTATIAGDAIVLDQDRIEIVGGFYFTLAEGRAVDSVLADDVKYPTSAIIERRIEVEDEAELICSQAFVPRFARVTLDGNGRAALFTGHPWLRSIRSVSTAPFYGAAATTLDAEALARVAPNPTGVITAPSGTVWPEGRQNIVVELEHGLDRPTAGIVRAARIRLKSLLLSGRSALPDRADRIAVTELGTVLLATASGEKTGIPDVDAEYERVPKPIPGFG